MMNHTRIKQAIADIEKYEAALEWFTNHGINHAFEREDVTVKTHYAGACHGHKEAMQVLSAYAYHSLDDILATSIKSCHNTIAMCRDIIREESLKS